MKRFNFIFKITEKKREKIQKEKCLFRFISRLRIKIVTERRGVGGFKMLKIIYLNVCLEAIKGVKTNNDGIKVNFGFTYELQNKQIFVVCKLLFSDP